jgi:hypothetical protein
LRTRPPRFGCLRNWLWFRPSSPGRSWNLGCDQRKWDLSCTPAAGVPFLLIMDPDPDPDLGVDLGVDLDLGAAPGSGGLAVIIQERGWGVKGRHHSQSRRHPAATDSSRTGVPPSRGRPPTQPQGTVMHQPSHPHEATGSRRTGGTTREARITGRGPGGPSRERRAHRLAPDQTRSEDRQDRAKRPRAWSGSPGHRSPGLPQNGT